jgi:hypothetical protein
LECGGAPPLSGTTDLARAKAPEHWRTPKRWRGFPRSLVPKRPPRSGEFLALWHLTDAEEGLYQLAFAAHIQLGKALEPSAVRHFGIPFDPIQEQAELSFGNLALSDAIEKGGAEARAELLSDEF